MVYGPGLEEGLTLDGRVLADAEITDLASAPDGCVVCMELTTDNEPQAVKLKSKNSAFLKHPIVRVIRVTDHEVAVENEHFELHDHAREQGVGVLALALQVRACLDVGVVRLDAYAAGGHGSAFTGYYVWPKLGFDARVPGWLWHQFGAQRLAELDLDFTKPGWVSDLMATTEGAALWRLAGKNL